MKKIIFNPATDKFENMEAEMVDVKTRKPNAVPPKTQTFKKPVAPVQDDFEMINYVLYCYGNPLSSERC